MGAEFIATMVSSFASSSINRLLSKSVPNLFEIKQIVLNGTSDTINFIIHFIKTSKQKNILKRLFTKGEIYTFEKDFTIKITNSIGHDVTRDILEYDTAKIIVPFEKFFDLSGRRFIIHARGRFRANYKEIFLLCPEHEPIIKNDQRIVYRTKIVVYNKKYDAEELTFINIPFRQIFPIDFLGPKLLTSREVKAFHHLNKVPIGSSIYRRRKKQLTQTWGFEPERLNEVISSFLRAFEALVTRRFREFIIATSETHSVQVTKLELEFQRVQEGLPTVFLRPTICFDYSNRDSNVIDISISLNKEVILKLTTKLWSKFKGPKRTAPRKTLH